MKNKDRQLWENKKPIYIDWENIVFEIVVLAALALIMFLACSVGSNAHYVESPIAGINKQLMVVHTVAEIRGQKMYEAEREEERRKQNYQMAYEGFLIQRFGYLPSSDAVKRLKSIVMEEGGNTEDVEGIVAMFIAASHRVTFREGDNPNYHFPNTIDEVIRQVNQFDTYSNGAYLRFRTNEKVEKAWEIFLTYDYPSDFRYVQYYDELYAWSAGDYNSYFTKVVKIGNHYFGGLKD